MDCTADWHTKKFINDQLLIIKIAIVLFTKNKREFYLCWNPASKNLVES